MTEINISMSDEHAQRAIVVVAKKLRLKEAGTIEDLQTFIRNFLENTVENCELSEAKKVVTVQKINVEVTIK
jgi:hypothetical protein